MLEDVYVRKRTQFNQMVQNSSVLQIDGCQLWKSGVFLLTNEKTITIQIAKINYIDMCYQFTYFTLDIMQMIRGLICVLSCMMRCMCVLIVNRCRVCTGNGQ